MAKEYGTLSSGIVDIPTSFDGTWSSRGWTASRGVVTAIAEISSQVLDVSLKCRVCNQCNVMEERKQNEPVTVIEYPDWFVVHEPNCLKKHFASPQVRDSISTFKVTVFPLLNAHLLHIEHQNSGMIYQMNYWTQRAYLNSKPQ